MRHLVAAAVGMYVHRRMYIYIYIYVYRRKYIYIYVCMYVCMYVYIYIYIYIYMTTDDRSVACLTSWLWMKDQMQTNEQVVMQLEWIILLAQLLDSTYAIEQLVGPEEIVCRSTAMTYMLYKILLIYYIILHYIINIYIYIYLCTHLSLYICIYIYIYSAPPAAPAAQHVIYVAVRERIRVYIYIYIRLSGYISIYIYIYRERERFLNTSVWIYT